jgi:hypothetical protein
LDARAGRRVTADPSDGGGFRMRPVASEFAKSAFFPDARKKGPKKSCLALTG